MLSWVGRPGLVANAIRERMDAGTVRWMVPGWIQCIRHNIGSQSFNINQLRQFMWCYCVRFLLFFFYFFFFDIYYFVLFCSSSSFRILFWIDSVIIMGSATTFYVRINNKTSVIYRSGWRWTSPTSRGPGWIVRSHRILNLWRVIGWMCVVWVRFALRYA